MLKIKRKTSRKIVEYIIVGVMAMHALSICKGIIDPPNRSGWTEPTKGEQLSTNKVKKSLSKARKYVENKDKRRIKKSFRLNL